MRAFFFLCQAEDGIRDYKVTGVQTCALPIQAEDGIRDYKVTGVQTCALPISDAWCSSYNTGNPIPANYITNPLNQNTTGTAANLSGTPALPNHTTATTQACGITSDIATDDYVAMCGGGNGTVTAVTCAAGCTLPHNHLWR